MSGNCLRTFILDIIISFLTTSWNKSVTFSRFKYSRERQAAYITINSSREIDMRGKEICKDIKQQYRMRRKN
jgi:hypothetical protein